VRLFSRSKLLVGLPKQTLDTRPLARIDFLIQQALEMFDVPPSNEPIHDASRR